MEITSDLKKRQRGVRASLLCGVCLCGIGWAAVAAKIPVVDVTDLYHPPQDVGDNVDLLAAYALEELDLRAVILDCTEPFRQPVARNPGPGLAEDRHGPREPGFIPVWQLNYVFDRAVPCGVGPYQRMRSPTDTLADAPAFQQQGLELLLRVLRESDQPVEIVSFGSARPVAAAYNREPELFRRKLRRLHLCAGASAPGFLEWNVALDPHAMVALLRSSLPIAIYPCAANNAQQGVPVFSYDSHNTYYKLPDLQFVRQMDPPLRRYLEFALSRSGRLDFLRAMETDEPLGDGSYLGLPHNVWETAVWLCLTGRQLVQRADGSYRILRPEAVRPTDQRLPNELRPCKVTVRENGIFEFQETRGPSNFWIYFRGDPRQNEKALQAALPALYLEFRASFRKPPAK